jgi:hypothetical protein
MEISVLASAPDIRAGGGKAKAFRAFVNAGTANIAYENGRAGFARPLSVFSCLERGDDQLVVAGVISA